MPRKISSLDPGAVSAEVIEHKIFLLRGHRAMFDRDLAGLYGVSTKVLNQAVKRKKKRFPKDFMLRLDNAEARAALFSRSQIVTLKRGHNLKYKPCVFTEHGALMLANVLKSDTAIWVSLQMVRAFVHLRQAIATQETFARHLEALERKIGKHDADLLGILTILKKLLDPPPLPPKHPIGFSVEDNRT